MKLEHAEMLCESAEGMGLEVELYVGYSGRGMYGKTTTGVVGSIQDIVQAVAAVAANLDNDSDRSEFVRDMKLSWGNMGQNMIAY